MGLFEHLAQTDEYHRTLARKAVALARTRAENSYGNFIRAASTVDEREERLELIAGELENTVRQACADVDYPAWDNVLESVQTHLGMVVEARKPKMCPYHSEVTDISLAAGDPQAGFAAMAQHAWGTNHCQGEFEGRCNFKPEMTTQTYWDKKSEQAEERRRQREEQRQQEQMQPEPEVLEIASEGEAENLDYDSADWGDSAVADGAPEPMVEEPQMAMAASRRQAATVPNPLVHGGSLAPLRQIAQRKPGLMIDGLDFAQWEQQVMQLGPMPEIPSVEVTHPNPTWEGIAAAILQTGSPKPLKDYFDQKRQQQAPMQQAPMQPQARTGEALKTIDVERSVGPVPEIDKRKWTPENVQFVDAEMDGSPHPTRRQDIAEPATYRGNTPFEDDGRFEQTDAVLEKQDVEEKADYQGGKAHGEWSSGGDRSAVSSHQADFRQDLGAGQDFGAGSGALQQRLNQQPCRNCGQPAQAGVCQSCGFAEQGSGTHGPAAGEPYGTYGPGAGRSPLVDPQLGRQANDPDKNPIAELLEEEEAQRAITEFKAAGVPVGSPCPHCGQPVMDEAGNCPSCLNGQGASEFQERVPFHDPGLAAEAERNDPRTQYMNGERY